VQGADGKEAYTRAGNLQVDANGQLMTATGPPVLATAVRSTFRRTPPSSSRATARSPIVAQGQTPDTTATVARIKLVNPPNDRSQRGDDGLFRMKDGRTRRRTPPCSSVPACSSQQRQPPEAMVNMIELARQFEMQVKAIRTAEENAQPRPHSCASVI
jgi:flagellar basal-body rod protein FlgF